MSLSDAPEIDFADASNTTLSLVVVDDSLIAEMVVLPRRRLQFCRWRTGSLHGLSPCTPGSIDVLKVS